MLNRSWTAGVYRGPRPALFAYLLAAFSMSMTFVCVSQERITARQILPRVDSIAQSYRSGVQLGSITGDAVDTSGRAVLWTYIYFWLDTSRFLNSIEYYFVGQKDSVKFDHTHALGAGPMVLFQPWMDSDSAVLFGQRYLGTAIRKRYPSCSLNASVSQEPAPPFLGEWWIDYHCPDSMRTVVIDATSGALLRQYAVVTSIAGSLAAPEGYLLLQNYPNPFNPATTIRYALPKRARVMLTVFNTLGQKIAVLVDAVEEPGEHSVRFDGSDVASGVYYYRLQALGFSKTMTLVVVR